MTETTYRDTTKAMRERYSAVWHQYVEGCIEAGKYALKMQQKASPQGNRPLAGMRSQARKNAVGNDKQMQQK